MNPYRLKWIVRVRIDAALSPESKLVAEILVTAGLLSLIAMTDWQDVNRALRRHPRDTLVRTEISELQDAGYLGRWQGNRFAQSRGWRLTLPEEALALLEVRE